MAKYQPISEAEKSAAVFEQAFTEGQTQVGAQGLRARLAAEQQAAVEALVGKMRKDLFDISCKNTTAAEDGKRLVADAYGW
jgi:hypothetical protein